MGMWGLGLCVVMVFCLLGSFYRFSNQKAPHGASAGARMEYSLLWKLLHHVKGLGF